jgi:archaellum biogenesis ATPase FlaH
MGELRKLYPEGHISDADLKRDVAKLTTPPVETNVLEVKTANEWIEEAKNKPIPLRLLDCLWYEGELAILFADTNLGKSIFAVQIADALCNQTKIEPFSMSNKKFSVLYCDFEMSDKQFENRYSEEYKAHYLFSPNFHRAELNLDEFLLKDGIPIEDQIYNEIISYIIKHRVDVVIIDNLTYIAREIEQSKNIAPLMQKLKLINKKYNTSILVLAHTPKRDLSRPITNNDINGSKFLANFADSIFAIGKSAINEKLRYVKQIKSRNSEYIFGAENVAIYIIEKDFNFLSFKFQNTDDEQDHLQVRSKADLAELDQQILEEHNKNPDLSFGKIAEILCTNKMRVKRVIDRICIS